MLLYIVMVAVIYEFALEIGRSRRKKKELKKFKNQFNKSLSQLLRIEERIFEIEFNYPTQKERRLLQQIAHKQSDI